QAVQQLITSQLPTSAVDHELDILSPTAVTDPLNQCQQVDANFNQTPPRIAGRLLVRLQCDDRVQPIYVQVRVHVIADYWLAARYLPVKHTLTADDIVVVLCYISRLPRHAMLAVTYTLSFYLGRQLKRSISQNTVLQATLLSSPH